jgi:hypothetical protein
VKTVVMKRSDADKKKVEESYATPFHPGGDDYPYGLHITLDNDSLSKLGIDGIPKPGDKFKIAGEAHVLSSEQRDTDQKSDRRVELVLHELGAEPKPGNSSDRQKSVREDLEDARHQARGTTAPGPGRIGARIG